MKLSPWEWTEADLLSLIKEGTQESLTLDFKQSDALQKADNKKNELAKDVSSFANAAGGTIIYGMKEDGHIPIGLDDGLDPDEISKEWIEQVINSRIQRRIDGVRVNQIQLSNSTGRVVYVVYIPQSTRAPHQAHDKRFYKRFNFEAIPMEEYEVRDTANRSSAPLIKVKLEFKPGGDTASLSAVDDDYYEPVSLSMMVSNESHAPAEVAVFHLYLDTRIQLEGVSSDCQFIDSSAISFDVEGESVSLSKLTVLWDRSRGLPIFRGISADLPSKPIRLKFPLKPSVYAVRFEFAAPGMEPKDQLLFLVVGNGKVSIKAPSADGQ